MKKLLYSLTLCLLIISLSGPVPIHAETAVPSGMGMIEIINSDMSPELKALELVKLYLGGEYESLNTEALSYSYQGSPYLIQYDHKVGGNVHMVHEYEFVIDDPGTGKGHAATANWFEVNIATGGITPLFYSDEVDTDYSPNPCFGGKYSDTIESYSTVLIVDGQYIPDVHPIVADGGIAIPLRYIKGGAEVEIMEGTANAIPYIVAVTTLESRANKTVKISEAEALAVVKYFFKEEDWNEFLTEQYGDIYSMLEFTSAGAFGNFWVIDIESIDERSGAPYASVWVDMYTGDIFSKDFGYEGVYSVEAGISRALNAITYRFT